MCLAIPGAITSIDGSSATIDMLGVTQQVSLALTPAAKLGNWVLVHAGFAIEVIDAEEAERTIELVRELDELAAEDLAGHAPNGASATAAYADGAQAAEASVSANTSASSMRAVAGASA